MRGNYAAAGRTGYVAMVGTETCGHQHETVRAAKNCGGTAYKIIRTRTKGAVDRRELTVTFRKVST